MKIPVNTFRIKCDGCGANFENEEGWSCYSDYPNGIIDDASDSGWLITSDEHHYCPDCHQLNDNDEYVCKDGKKYNEDFEPLNVMEE